MCRKQTVVQTPPGGDRFYTVCGGSSCASIEFIFILTRELTGTSLTYKFPKMG
jgi:hypothetical protein